MASSTSRTTIDLNCPGCEARLELDRGFAGGVCRCSTCGTLMTVPRLANEKAEKLVRAERPGEAPPSRAARSERPERPERPESPTSGKPSGSSFTSNARPQDRLGPSASGAAWADPGDTGDTGEQLYRTASGREVRVDERRVPMAEAKRKAIRAATVVVFFAIVGGVLGLCGLAAYLLVTQPTAQDLAASNYVETFTYDKTANPYAIEAPNLLGLPLSHRVALVLDPSGMSAEAWDIVGRAAAVNVGADAANVLVTVVVLEGAEASMPLNQVPMRPERSASLSAALEGVAPEAVTATLEAGLAAALRVRPEVVIVATGRRLTPAQGAAAGAQIPEEGVRFDALLIDADSFELEDAARRTQGHYVSLSGAYDLSAWRAQ